MKARGLSLKPIWWFTGFMLLVVGPQVVYRTMVAVSGPRTGSTVPRVENPELLFSEAPEGAGVVDVQPQMTAGLLSTAQRGRFITLPTSGQLLVYLRPAGNEITAHRNDHKCRLALAARRLAGAGKSKVASRVRSSNMFSPWQEET